MICITICISKTLFARDADYRLSQFGSCHLQKILHPYLAVQDCPSLDQPLYNEYFTFFRNINIFF